MWTNTSTDGAGRQAVRSQQREQQLKSARRTSPEVKAIARTFGVSYAEARNILAAARRQK